MRSALSIENAHHREGTFIGIDAAGEPWMVRWNVAGGEGVWTAFGFDERGYPCARPIAGAYVDMIVAAWPADIVTEDLLKTRPMYRRLPA